MSPAESSLEMNPGIPQDPHGQASEHLDSWIFLN